MNRTARIALAIGVPAAVLAVAGTPVVAEPPPAGDFPTPSGAVPADWTWIVDDTATISIRVPSAWTDVDPAPPDIAGEPLPMISATTDADRFFPVGFTAESLGVPGLVFAAGSFTADTAASFATSSYRALCTAGPAQRFDDGLYVGHIQFFEDCSGTASDIVQLAANPADGAFTLRLLVQLTGQPDDDATLDGLLSSFATIEDHTAPTESPTSDDPGLSLVQHVVQEELGLTITDDEARCLLDTVMYVDPADFSSVYAALYTCGVDLFDVPSG